MLFPKKKTPIWLIRIISFQYVNERLSKPLVSGVFAKGEPSSNFSFENTLNESQSQNTIK
jgi:hypothetical protein